MNGRVLVIDDSLTVRMSLSGLLESNGIASRGVADLAAARIAMAEEPFALLLLDVELPDGDGIDFLREIRTTPRFASMPVMLLSTRAEVEDRVRGLERGADDYLGKPYDPAMVVRRVRELTTREQASDKAIRLLVIEDSLTYSAYIRDLLQKQGYEVLIAETGEDGLRVAAEARPAAIVVDAKLPGLPGPEVIRQIRQDAALRRTPTLLLTASTEADVELRALEAGADSFLRKGQDPNVILACINVLLRSSTAPMAATRLPSTSRVVCITHGRRFTRELQHAAGSRSEFEFQNNVNEFLAQPSATPPDCILIDAGDEIQYAREETRALRKQPELRDVTILVVGAAPYSGALMPTVDAGADDYLSAAAGTEIVAARLSAQLRRKQYEDEARGIREQLLRSELTARAQRELAIAASMKNEELKRLARIAEKEAREADQARREFQQLAEAIPQIVWTADPTGEITYFNRRWYEYSGATADESLGYQWTNALPGSMREEQNNLWLKAVAGRTTYTAEYQLRRADGAYRWFLARALPMYDDSGRVLRWFGTSTDIEDRKNAEEALRRSEKLAATGRLAASIAHEINNPLEAVVNLVFIARTLLESAPKQAEDYLRIADQELARVSQISKRTLAFYRDPTSAERTDLCALVDDVANIYAPRASAMGISLNCELHCSRKPYTLPGEIRQVMSNLLANALDATPRDGTIRIRVRDATIQRSHQPGVRILVSDTGTGIAEAFRNKLFHAFITSKADRGTGLGLWVSASIVERHNGEIRVRTRNKGAHTGTCFSVLLPENGTIRTDADETSELLKALGRDLLRGE